MRWGRAREHTRGGLSLTRGWMRVLMKAASMMWLRRSCLLSGKQAGQPRETGWQHWPRSNMRSWRRRPGRLRGRGHHRRCLRSDGVHDLGITMIFLQNNKERDKRKEEKRKMFHELCERGQSRTHEGSRDGEWVADRVAGVASHCVSSPWWAGGRVAEAAVPSPGEQANDFGKGQGEGWVTPPGRHNWLPRPS